MGHFRVEHVVDTHDKQATFAVDCTGNARNTRQMGHFRVEHVVDTHDKQATFPVDCTGNAPEKGYFPS